MFNSFHVAIQSDSARQFPLAELSIGYLLCPSGVPSELLGTFPQTYLLETSLTSCLIRAQSLFLALGALVRPGVIF